MQVYVGMRPGDAGEMEILASRRVQWMNKLTSDRER